LLLSDSLGLGLLDADAARLDKLVAAARAAIKKDPDDAVAHCHLGVGCFKREQYEEAVKEFARAVQLRPEAWGVIYLEAFATALGRSWTHPAVEQLCKQALGLNPQFREATSLLHIYAGRMAAESSEPDNETALGEFRQALALEIPEHMPYIYDFSGQAFDEAEDKDNAIKMYQEACQRGFVNAMILTRLGILLKDTGQARLAIFELEKAEELDPTNPGIKDMLSQLKAKSAKG
jgi:tetratricopeptide (TPR) repeat protein